jgi:hypothetical protein
MNNMKTNHTVHRIVVFSILIGTFFLMLILTRRNQAWLAEHANDNVYTAPMRGRVLEETCTASATAACAGAPLSLPAGGDGGPWTGHSATHADNHAHGHHGGHAQPAHAPTVRLHLGVRNQRHGQGHEEHEHEEEEEGVCTEIDADEHHEYEEEHEHGHGHGHNAEHHAEHGHDEHHNEHGHVGHHNTHHNTHPNTHSTHHNAHHNAHHNTHYGQGHPVRAQATRAPGFPRGHRAQTLDIHAFRARAARFPHAPLDETDRLFVRRGEDGPPVFRGSASRDAPRRWESAAAREAPHPRYRRGGREL